MMYYLLFVQNIIPNVTDAFVEYCLKELNLKYTWVSSNSSLEEQEFQLYDKMKWAKNSWRISNMDELCVLKVIENGFTTSYIVYGKIKDIEPKLIKLHKIKAFI